MSPHKPTLGVIGLAVMGRSLARNAARRGHRVVVYNRTTSRMTEMVAAYGHEGDLVGEETLEGFVAALPEPRCILVMVQAAGLDAVLRELVPLLAPGDVVVDGGNSLYLETARRAREVSQLNPGVHYVGMGVSGGESGALNGPSLMVGAPAEAWAVAEPVLGPLAAADGLGGTCCAHLGGSPVGHFVKMVHNGIEYAIMAALSETIAFMRAAGMAADDIAAALRAWSADDAAGGFLTEIMAIVLAKRDPEHPEQPLLDDVADSVGQKGTGRWTAEAAGRYGVAVPSIVAAADSRVLSSSSDLRAACAALLARPAPEGAFALTPDVAETARLAFAAAAGLAFGQGFELMRVAAEKEGWDVNLVECCRIWRDGCIIRSPLLPRLQASLVASASQTTPAPACWLGRSGNADGDMQGVVSGAGAQALRRMTAAMTLAGLPCPVLAATASYHAALASSRLEHMAATQALRDCFGAHGFTRVSTGQTVHVAWMAAE